jgi:hypothetical protein
VRGLAKVALHADLTMLARLSLAPSLDGLVQPLRLLAHEGFRSWRSREPFQVFRQHLALR